MSAGNLTYTSYLGINLWCSLPEVLSWCQHSIINSSISSSVTSYSKCPVIKVQQQEELSNVKRQSPAAAAAVTSHSIHSFIRSSLNHRPQTLTPTTRHCFLGDIRIRCRVPSHTRSAIWWIDRELSERQLSFRQRHSTVTCHSIVTPTKPHRLNPHLAFHWHSLNFIPSQIVHDEWIIERR